MKKAVLFDLIGTLVVSKEKRPLSSIHAILADNGLNATLEAFTAAWGQEPPGTPVPSSHTQHTPFEKNIGYIADIFNWIVDWEHIERIANYICHEVFTILSVDNEVPALFQKLYGKTEIGLVSNYDHPPAIRKFLANNGLSDYFSSIIISGEIGKWKPDPEILHHAIRAMSLKPSDCIYIGDSSVDVEAAISAGVDPIFIDRNNGFTDPCRELEDDVKSKFRSLIDSQKLGVIKSLGEIEKYLHK
jgi:FMN phosphatase YigB (HAD superfamily)